jgi:phage anti-repressor protein
MGNLINMEGELLGVRQLEHGGGYGLFFELKGGTHAVVSISDKNAAEMEKPLTTAIVKGSTTNYITQKGYQMNALIAINTSTISNETKQTVNARDLHGFLESKADFSTWIKNQIERARLVENRDYVTVTKKVERQILVEYHLTIEAGKSIGMMSATDKGFEIRDYFLDCERRALQPAPAIPNDPIILLRMEQLGMSEKINVVTTGLVETRHAVDQLKQNMRVENWQQCNIQKAAHAKAGEFKELYPHIDYGDAIRKIWRFFKNKFDLPRYQELPAMKYDEAMKTLHNLAMHNLAGL